jgi:hypothetical protein
MRPHSLLLQCPKSYNRICFSPTLHSHMGSLSKSHSPLIILTKQGWPWSETLDLRRRVGKALIIGRASCQFLPPLLSCHSLPILSPGRKKVERKQAHRSATSFANCGCELPVSNLIEFVAIFSRFSFPFRQVFFLYFSRLPCLLALPVLIRSPLLWIFHIYPSTLSDTVYFLVGRSGFGVNYSFRLMQIDVPLQCRKQSQARPWGKTAELITKM